MTTSIFNEMQLKITLLVLPLAFLLVDGTPLDQEVLYVDRGLVVDVGDGDEEGGDGEVNQFDLSISIVPVG